MANVVVEPTPLGMTPNPKTKTPPPVFEVGTSPGRPGIPIYRMGAHGNGYANRGYLSKRLAEKGQELGADFVMLEQQQVNAGPVVTSFGNGMAISDQVHTLSLYGTAYVWSPVKLGVRWGGPNFEIADIEPTGPGAAAGLKIGDRLLAVNDIRVMADPYAVSRITSKAKPGDVVKLEILDRQGNQRLVNARFVAND
jgi:hypothetical protein